MKSSIKVIFKILLFVINLVLGIVATVYLVIKFKARKKNKSDQLELIKTDESEEFKNVVSQGKRTDQVYKLIKHFKEVDMAFILTKIEGVTERTLRRDLAKLQTMRLIKKSGSTKSAKYSTLK